QNDVTLKMPAFEWVHVQLHQQKGMISLSPPTICNSAHAAASCISRTTSSISPEQATRTFGGSSLSIRSPGAV
ncbi:hypothetical protein ACJHW3_25180, partial [Escherichia sp. WS1707]|uniref:hypothetical protein n=1 Tax=Escherichia sp. WS1707 TaxID=3381946 RepID=UPI00396F4C9D